MTSRDSAQLTPIFITGLPRSGTTWASRAIRIATAGRLVHEPFNWKQYPDRVSYHMKYVPAGFDDAGLLGVLQQQMKPEIPLLTTLLTTRRVVVKDVHVCLAVEHVWDRLRPHVIILTRHPCAVANSWANLGLRVRFRLQLLLSQEKLVEDHLSAFRSHMLSRNDYFFALGAYWGASYYVLKHLALGHREWQWVTHEALCLQQATCFERILEQLGVGLKAANRRSLQVFLRRKNRSRRTEEGPYSLARVGAEEVEKWKTRLTDDQIQAVMDGTQPFGVWEDSYAG